MPTSDDTLVIQMDDLTWKRNCNWIQIVRLMRHADEGDTSAVKKLKDEYEMNYIPATTTEPLKKEIDETKDENE